eukprot:m.287898 g.287898  ORF g.287898 m.287898 type:complete len:900 (+) comp16368_c0_seq19:280-2979(+)
MTKKEKSLNCQDVKMSSVNDLMEHTELAQHGGTAPTKSPPPSSGLGTDTMTISPKASPPPTVTASVISPSTIVVGRSRLKLKTIPPVSDSRKKKKNMTVAKLLEEGIVCADAKTIIPFSSVPLTMDPKLVRQRELLLALKTLHDEIVRWDESDSRIFLLPVDRKIAPGYYEYIKQPMDLSTIEKKIIRLEYKSAWKYLDDMHLMINNALAFNKPGSFHNKYAQKLQKYWVPKAEEMMLKTLASHDYCCGRKRLLSGHAYRCRGATCFIKYGCVYWYYDPQDGEDEILYCQAHYAKLSVEITIPRFGNGTGGDITFLKSQLKRAKHNTPLVGEKLVECVSCGHEAHEICRMYNSYRSEPYKCEKCMKDANEETPPIQSPKDLPCTKLSNALQAEVATRVPLVGRLVCVRVVNMEHMANEVKPIFRQRFPDHPSKLPYTHKVILCFMDVEGRPVCFFGMIVHECGNSTPEPNKNRVYISLLDSVKLPKSMLPSQYRTAIYHSILRGYLRYCGQLGFRYAHIYTCPPRKGQNYIFPFKPDDQKEISSQRLRKWYFDMLQFGTTQTPPAIRGFQNIGDVFAKHDLRELPYFDGDNWPDIIEDILKLDNRQKSDEELLKKIEERVDTQSKEIWAQVKEDERAQYRKPRLLNGVYEGIALMRPRKRKKSSGPIRPPILKYTLQQRLNLVMGQLKRDFLVVELVTGSKEGVVVDPDKDVEVARVDPEHSVQSFMRSEKLEFSSLRHAKYSTMMLLFTLFHDHSKDKVKERFPDNNNNGRSPSRAQDRDERCCSPGRINLGEGEEGENMETTEGGGHNEEEGEEGEEEDGGEGETVEGEDAHERETASVHPAASSDTGDSGVAYLTPQGTPPQTRDNENTKEKESDKTKEIHRSEQSENMDTSAEHH